MPDSRPQGYRDREGYLWLTAVTPDGKTELFCYDTGAQRRMGERWPTLPPERVEAEYGPLLPLGPSGEDDDIVLFLYGGGSVPVDPDGWRQANGGWEGRTFAEIMPGYGILLLGMGQYQVEDLEWISGVYVVIRRTA
jgi:hypothetical protein